MWRHWRHASAALVLCWCCAALAARGLRAVDGGGEGGEGGGGGVPAAVAGGAAREARFVLGSRYGRSAPAPRFMSPRNDRFFMSSRYGKRSALGGFGGRSGAVGGKRACRCGPYRYRPPLAPARYTRRGRPDAGSTSRAG